MCCITFVAQQATMATTQLTRAGGYEIGWPRQNQETEFRPLRMSWVVVTDENGSCPLRMCWNAEEKELRNRG